MFGKILISVLMIIVLFNSCTPEIAVNEIKYVDWTSRSITEPKSNLEKGESYLSVYSQIYSQNADKVTDLTVTISIRNLNLDKEIYLGGADYYNTFGELVKSYIENPIYISPMETLEIVIAQKDTKGGTGGNFYFTWEKDSIAIEPLFESVMISTSGQQGISFVTKGIRVN